MTRRRNTLLMGHALAFEGRAYADSKCAICQTGGAIGGGRSHYSSAGAGHAHCECGSQSGHLDSGVARRRWHAQHKAVVSGETS